MKLAFIYSAMSLGGRPFDFPNLWTSPRGTTGSEISLLCFAKEMGKRGHDVTLYVPSPNATSFDGVSVRDRDNWRAEAEPYDVAYSWNEPEALRGVSPKVLRVVNQQLNDWAYCNPGFDDHVDLYTSPSSSHMGRIGAMAADGDLSKWTVLSNGVYPDVYDLDHKVPGRVVWTSSPDRGLHLLLSAWPRIRKVVPHATLRIFYFSLQRWLDLSTEFESSTHVNPDLREHAHRAQYVKRLLAHKDRLGITVVGSASRQQMVKELSEAQVLGAPFDTIAWTEGFCVAALEGCASGALPIISDVDALGEIYGGHTPMVAAPAHRHMDEWTELAIRALTDEPWRQSWVERARTRAQDFAWPKLAERLEKILEKGLAAKKTTATISVVDKATPAFDAVLAKAIDVAKALDTAKVEVLNSGVTTIRTKWPAIDLTLTSAAASGQTIDPLHPERDAHGGGARAGFLGLVSALPALGYTVRAFCPVATRVQRNGVEYVPIGQIRSGGLPDVLLAYFDTSPLGGVTGPLRIASHHTYQPFPAPSFDSFDVNTMPSADSCNAMRRLWDTWGDWRVLPNASAELGVKHAPVAGRVLFHTSPSRGLHLLVQAWPEIKARVPHASLHIIGDIAGYTSGHNMQPHMAKAQGGIRARALRAALEAARGQDVEVLGYLSRQAVNRELSEAACFAFPSDVAYPCETFSISILECCRLGVPVVLSPVDALASIYAGAVRMTSAPARHHMPEFVDAVVDVLESEVSASYWSEQGKKLAAKYTFENAAKALDEIIRNQRPELFAAPPKRLNGIDAAPMGFGFPLGVFTQSVRVGI